MRIRSFAFSLLLLASGCSSTLGRISLIVVDENALKELKPVPVQGWKTITKTRTGMGTSLNDVYDLNALIDSAFLTDSKIDAFENFQINADLQSFGTLQQTSYTFSGTPVMFGKK